MNDLYFMAKNQKGSEIKSLSQKVYIIRHEVAEYHPSENEYISLSGEYLIITEFFCTLMRDDMQKRAKKSLFLMISTTLRAVIICHYSVMDKKSRINVIRLFCVITHSLIQ